MWYHQPQVLWSNDAESVMLQHNYNSGPSVSLRPVYKYMLPGQQRLSTEHPAIGTGLLGLDNTLLHIHHNVTAQVKWGAAHSSKITSEHANHFKWSFRWKKHRLSTDRLHKDCKKDIFWRGNFCEGGMKGRQMYTLPRQGSGESGSGYSVRSEDLRWVFRVLIRK